MATTIFRGLEHSIGEEVEEGRKYGVNSQHADQHACHVVDREHVAGVQSSTLLPRAATCALSSEFFLTWLYPHK